MSGPKLLFVEQVVVLQWSHVLVELENQRAGSRDVVSKNLLLAHTSQVLDDCTEGVAVGDHDHSLSGDDLRADSVIPVGQDAINGGLERLSLRKYIGRK